MRVCSEYLRCLGRNSIFNANLKFVSMQFVFKTIIYITASKTIAQPIDNNGLMAAQLVRSGLSIRITCSFQLYLVPL